ncbi:MAG: DUF192 domain-containing protein [Planctomycetaceae bacterium]|jgi:uncharacterized membrane protein (UPF0127 family)|nr:DUF192 domain-containing protein [Planctomycetaceae bacterium]
MPEPSRHNELRWVTDDGRVLAATVRVADSYWKRLVGLQFSRSMPTNCVLWLQGCRSVHTAWMRYSIDIFFLDESLRVVDVRLGVPPWRIVRSKSRDAKHVLEAQHLESSGFIQAGLQTQFDSMNGGNES